MAGMSNKMKHGMKGAGMMAISVKESEPSELRLHICVEDANVDGVKKKVYKVKDCCMMGDENEGIFTDKQKFIDEISKRIDAKVPAGKAEDDGSETESDTEE